MKELKRQSTFPIEEKFRGGTIVLEELQKEGVRCTGVMYDKFCTGPAIGAQCLDLFRTHQILQTFLELLTLAGGLCGAMEDDETSSDDDEANPHEALLVQNMMAFIGEGVA